VGDGDGSDGYGDEGGGRTMATMAMTATKRAMVRAAKAMATASKRAMARAARAMATVSKTALTAAARAMAAATRSAMVRLARVMATATRVSGEGRRRRRRGQWQQQGVWRATKRALAMEIAIATMIRVLGDEKGNVKGG
jgi:hypothetical protein